MDKAFQQPHSGEVPNQSNSVRMERYSASVEKRAAVDCLRVRQPMGPPANMKRKPVMDLRSAVSPPPQSASPYA